MSQVKENNPTQLDRASSPLPAQEEGMVWSWRFDPLDANHGVEITYGGKACAIAPTLNNASLLVERLNRHDALVEENERLKQHIKDLDADLNGTIKECNDWHVDGRVA